jgi:hypothetical protein
MAWEDSKSVAAANPTLDKAWGQSPHRGTARACDGAVWPPRLERAHDEPLTAPARRMRNREHGVGLVSIVRTCSCSTCAALLAMILAVSAIAQDFHVEGVLEYDSAGEGNKLTSLARRAFAVDVASCRWRIYSRALDTVANSGDARLYIEITAVWNNVWAKMAQFRGVRRTANV